MSQRVHTDRVLLAVSHNLFPSWENSGNTSRGCDLKVVNRGQDGQQWVVRYQLKGCSVYLH